MENDIVSNAQRFAALGIPVFPLLPNAKEPPKGMSFPEMASTSPEKIKLFFFDPVLELVQPMNLGLLMRGFIGIDIDAKDGKKGIESLEMLSLCGLEFPPTLTQHTPTGGIHYVYSLPKNASVRNSVQSLAPGIDVRGGGGFLVGGGSSVPKGSYRTVWADVVPAPGWLLSRLARAATGTDTAKTASERSSVVAVNTEYALKRGKELVAAIEGAEQGSRDSRAYELACKLKNLGVTELDAFVLLDSEWAPRCNPPLPTEELCIPVENAFRYAKDSQPINAPEFEFDELPMDEPAEAKPAPKDNYVDEMNNNYAFVISGSSHHIIFETTDFKGHPKVAHYAEETFHKKLGSWTKIVGEKPVAVSRLWMKHPLRRYYEGFCFSPGREADGRYYNIWKGFNFQPQDLLSGSAEAREGLELFLEHSLKNICLGEQAHHDWLIGYFAHMFQRPWEKPEVAVVFRGKKGVGKNALLKHLKKMLAPHFIVASHKRYLEGNFNSHLEGLIGIVLDEMFWAGKKDIEGILKDLITGETHLIERKGMESYEIDSCLRTFILGNEKWIVPVTEDERRFAVFNVGDDRRQDQEFFERMRIGLEAGGYSLLLRYFLDYDLSKVKVRIAPNTIGLFEQKEFSMNPFERWWYECLYDCAIKGSTFLDGWPTTVTREELRDAYGNFRQKHRFNGWGESTVEFGKLVGRVLPNMEVHQLRENNKRIRSYIMPSIEDCRQEFERKMKHTIQWEE